MPILTSRTEDELAGPPIPPEREHARTEQPDSAIEEAPSDASVPLAAVLAFLAGITIAGWSALTLWYGLAEHADTPFFAFEKIPGAFDSPAIRQTAITFLILALSFAAVVALLHKASRISRAAIIALAAMAIGAATINVLIYPVGALDVFNYMIELKLAWHHDENPYIVTFEQFQPDPYGRMAFLVDITLFYGPAWLSIMGLPVAIAGFTDVVQTLVALKIFNAILIAITAGLIGWFHRRSATMWMAVTLFLANPLVLFEGIANVHNDVLLTVFVVGAVVALERRSPLAGPLLALSALVKLYTVALAPIFIVVALRDRWSWRKIAVTVLLTVVTVTGTAVPWWGNGELVDGLRAGLEESQEMDHVSPLSLARQYAQEQQALDAFNTDHIRSRPSFEIVPQSTQDAISNGFTIAFIILMLAIAVAVWKGRPATLGAAETLLLLFLLMTNLYPWYLIPAIALLALRPDRISRWYILIATALGTIYYPMFVYAHFTSGWTRFQVHQFLALFLVAPIVIYLAARVVTWRRDVEPREVTEARAAEPAAPREVPGDAQPI